MCWFDLVRFGSVRFGWVRRSKRGKKKACLWCLPTHAAAETAEPAGSVGFGGMQGGAVGFGAYGFGGQKRAKSKAIYVVVFFVARFGLVRQSSVGFGGAEDARWPGGQEEKTPQALYWPHKRLILWFPGGRCCCHRRNRRRRRRRRHRYYQLAT